ncbi:hypothetical protein DQ384_38345 [Sphaerisporangium album]|uniref:Uncharacterized protein n=1 Tax=Sphaerisporangium album TaxID=509200 RepID=A0A367EN63_9ACTN|nr:hypothetical protein [Sphaerisporangium album]RCG19142.1 hypothetical protein DQ384_38345 [Sphaerisporangium album]
MVHRPPEQGPFLTRYLAVAATLGALVGLGLSAALALTGAGAGPIVGVWAAAVALGVALGAGLWARASIDSRRDDLR